jgi:hypothetical protein
MFISRPTPSGNNSLAAQISENDASNLFVSELVNDLLPDQFSLVVLVYSFRIS